MGLLLQFYLKNSIIFEICRWDIGTRITEKDRL